jgi:hypothetical protein
MLLQVEAEVEAVGVDVGALSHTEHTLEADTLLTCRMQQQQQRSAADIDYYTQMQPDLIHTTDLRTRAMHDATPNTHDTSGLTCVNRLGSMQLCPCGWCSHVSHSKTTAVQS